jgi:2-polyprenyl-6-methoxyphenol hydroxylase-like FAD-dependent oxidoreductase
VISRPELYNYLLEHVPPEKLLLGKQVQDVEQHDSDSVATCICTDGSRYQGIIVGADGAYSSVRQSLYRQLKDNGLLAAHDKRPLQYRYRALVGMTNPLDPNQFALIASEDSDTRVMISHGDSPFTVRVYLT